MQASVPLDIRPELHPGYQLHRFLGRGGFGEVWEAEDESGLHVALKFLPCDSHLAAAQELRAIQRIRELRHANLIHIHKVWSSPRYLVVAMELADGSLFDLLQIYQDELGVPILPEDLFPYLNQVAEVIDFLNGRHQIQGQQISLQHCDINPRNLLLFGDTAKVSDFSLTTPLSAPQRTHRRAGTLDFAAPEVFQGKLSDRTDQYALAVTYCLLRGGRLPFEDKLAAFEPNYVRPPPDLTMLPHPEQLLVARALAPIPYERWPSCKTLIDELERLAVPSNKRRSRRTEHRTCSRGQPSSG
jgi:serine/threonine protein kinase